MSGLSSDGLVSLSELRSLAQQFFEEEKVTAKQVVTVETRTVSARLLAFQYYNSSELGKNIAILNDDINVGSLSGEIEIFTS